MPDRVIGILAIIVVAKQNIGALVQVPEILQRTVIGMACPKVQREPCSAAIAEARELFRPDAGLRWLRSAIGKQHGHARLGTFSLDAASLLS